MLHFFFLSPAGLGTFLVSLGFLYFGLKRLASRRRQAAIDAANNKGNAAALLKKAEAEKAAADQANEPEFTPRVKFLVAVFSAFLFLYVGIEYCVGMYLATFAVESDLKVSSNIKNVDRPAFCQDRKYPNNLLGSSG